MTGMSTLLRKDYFEDALGGLGKLSQYIAEDYFMAKFLAEGWVIMLIKQKFVLFLFFKVSKVWFIPY